ncbi:protein stum homolog isoform X2 [Littorina saxatilis]|uniref:protein stum homolog isoform X2 n=1 Tax=Littorina saxatilis TaxID=31220 RepID=UPI0038B50D3F
MTGTSTEPEAQTSQSTSASGVPKRSSQKNTLHPSSANRDDPEGRGGAQILEVTEKHGTLYNSIPCMPLPVAIICCIFNIVVPGLGTFISAWTCLCGCKTRLGAPAKAFGCNLLAAFLQMVSFVIIVGWVWSIIWGMNFVQIATSEDEEEKKPADPAVLLVE